MHLHFLVCRPSLKAESDLRECLQGLTEAWQKDSACVLCLLSLNECISQLVSILGSALNSSRSPHWGDEPKQTFQRNQLDWTEEKEGKLQPANDVRQTGLSFPVQTQLCNKNASISQITPLQWPWTWYKSDGQKIPPSVLISILCIGSTFVLRSNVSRAFFRKLHANAGRYALCTQKAFSSKGVEDESLRLVSYLLEGEPEEIIWIVWSLCFWSTALSRRIARPHCSCGFMQG